MKDDLRKAALFALALFISLMGSRLVTDMVFEGKQRPQRSGLHAVFLSNGQVYFGNIGKEDNRTLVLNNIFYIQPKGGTITEGLTAQSDISLLKLGNELHGPEDWMEINREHILLIEKLKDDGKVGKAIRAYKEK